MSTQKTMVPQAPKQPADFIRKIVAEDLASGRCCKVVTRFPPEPNGYLHIGHAKAISISADIAAESGGDFILRLDDTNPVNEEQQFIDAIQEDVAWLGFGSQTGQELRYASDYFGIFAGFARYLIEQGLAYVDELDGEAINVYRGSPTVPGRDSPFRQRPAAESLRLFEEMAAGQHSEGAYTLRAKIDMQHANVHLRDPVIYRIKYQQHPRLQQCYLFPMYDFAHPLEDAIEGVTHSLCSLEFENHRPTYDWFAARFCEFRGQGRVPRQYEFARLAMSHTVMSKRSLRRLVESGAVSGWDDPRLPTICALRRRGFPAAALRQFVRSVGITKVPSEIGLELLYHCVREYLNCWAERRFAVLEPLKVVLENYPEGQTETLWADNRPVGGAAGSAGADSEGQQEDQAANPETRPLLFGRELWMEREDFMEAPLRKYFRLAPGREVRLKHAYYITCKEVVKDASGKVVELRCTYDPQSCGGQTPDARRVKGTIHWLCCQDAVAAEFRLYDLLFAQADLDLSNPEQDWKDYLNPQSLVIQHGYVEPSLAVLTAEQRRLAVQFLRLGYFIADSADYSPQAPVFNRAVGLRDSWAKQVAKQDRERSGAQSAAQKPS